jgi:hypothetical protein
LWGGSLSSPQAAKLLMTNSSSRNTKKGNF